MPIVTWAESFPPKPAFTEKDVSDQHGRVFIVTGGSSGCGYEIAKAVYHLNGRVYIAGRSAENAQRAIQSIKAQGPAEGQTVKSGKGELFFLQLDLNDLNTIKASAEQFLSREFRLDVIWHNAGLGGAPEGSVTTQGFETHLGVNVIGPFLFQHFLTPLCLRTASQPDVGRNAIRVIWVTSAGHRASPKPDGVNWNDMDMHTTGGFRGNMLKYGQSKAMCVMFAHEFARRYGPQGLISLSLHPGSIKTNFQRHQPTFFKIITSPLLYEQHYGALTGLFAGFSEEANTRMMEQGGRNGSYIEPWGRWGEGSEHVFEGLSQRDTGAKLWKVFDEMLKDYM